MSPTRLLTIKTFKPCLSPPLQVLSRAQFGKDELKKVVVGYARQSQERLEWMNC